MGRVAAPCSGPSRIVSFLTAVPCLSCKQQQRRRRRHHQSAAVDRGRRRMSEQGKSAASTPASGTPAPGSDTYKGWLFKWTNYIKGYQRRWFVLSNGLLSYYRTQAEMAHTCRGTINLATAHIDTEDTCNIVLSSGGRTYHLKASTEVERQRWVTALELAKAKAIRMMNDQSDNGPTAPLKHCYQSGKVTGLLTEALHHVCRAGV
ncbi:oxysterol-binding protein 2-like [Sinocyclocheilus rhinocerous]|uniref:oxysterol-binding protein 2-like n=1 Tax=Sinocyclocheilus rhinocerous TaxID=307959 RepID=UPI0007BAC149|nr:PREDICTED: oxysterol-binding protein 2-like [Sinocyclocheilus rhinocerous]